jgi:asparagine synthase (glutamine-hydrolysing)
MCGINGFLALSGLETKDPEQLIARMNGAIRHRGPDDEGVWRNAERTLYLGHRRLSILDLSSSGHQPMSLSDGTTVVFNGEIYNFCRLKSQLPRYLFRSQSDTELLLALYRSKGEACLDDLNGMFAFAIWDPAESRLFLARDRIGKKPLYYTTQGGVFAFSSEIKALVTLPWVRAELDEEALYYFLTFNFVPAPLTMFRNIFKFHPGHKMRVGPEGIQSYEPFWEVAYERQPERQEELEEKILTALRRSVDLRMTSDVPVGAFLSGGVDSGGIVALMSQRANYPIKTFSIGFAGESAYDESENARELARRYRTDHYARQVTREDLREFLPKVVDVFDEPMADPTSIPIYFLAEMASQQGTKVVLTGDGPDEILLGYRNWLPYVRLYPLYRAYGRLPRAIRVGVAAMAGYLDDRSPGYEILHRAAHNQEFFWGNAPTFKEGTKRRFLTPELSCRTRQFSCHDIISSFRNQYRKAGANVSLSDPNWMAYLGLKFIIPNFYMYRSDRLGMAHSVEIRAPYLDYEFVNLALSITPEWKTRRGVPKYIFKKALERELPQHVTSGPKRGFCVPLRQWAGDIMVDYLSQHLKRFCNETGLFHYAPMRQQVDAARNGRTNDAYNLWTIYFLVNWFHRWLR